MAPTALPPAEVTAGGLWIALDDQTARLEMANGHTSDAVAIMDRCEAERLKATPARSFWARLRP